MYSLSCSPSAIFDTPHIFCTFLRQCAWRTRPRRRQPELTFRGPAPVIFSRAFRTDNGSVNELGECALRFTRVSSYGAPRSSSSTSFRPPLLGHMAGTRYVTYLSSSLRSANAKVTGLRSRYVSVRTLATANASPFAALDTFADRHIGPDAHETAYMLKRLGYDSMDAFVAASVPAHIRIPEDAITNTTIPSLSESELTQRAKALGRDNKIFKSYIGMGYHNSVVPPVILRNVSLGTLARFVMESNREIDFGKSCVVYPLYPLPTRDCSRFV